MIPYVDTSINEDGKPEYSIHGLDDNTLRDLIVAADLLRFMLNKRLELPSFKGIIMDNKLFTRAETMHRIVWQGKKALKKNEFSY